MKDRFFAILRLLKRQRKLFIFIIIFAITVGLFYYRNLQLQKPQYTTATVQKGTLAQKITLSGSIQAEQNVNLQFATAGKISQLAVKEDDVVKKGQLIASLDQRSVKKNLQKTLNTFAKTRYDLDQQRDNYDDTITTDTVRRILEKAQYDVNNAIVDVELQNLTIEYSSLFSPVDGIVTSLHNIQPGMNVTAATDIASIVGPDRMYFELTADQTEVTTLNEGMKGTLMLDAFLDTKFPGTIERISFTPKAGESNTVYVVRFAFMSSSTSALKYKVGMTGDVDFVTAEKSNALYVPFAFVQEEGEKHYVQIMKKGKLQKRDVETGLETDDTIEITAGLSEGDIIYD